MGRLRRLLIAGLLLVSCTACLDWSADVDDRPVRSMDGPSTGSIQLFSGRVPPAWELSEQVRAELLRAMGSLPAMPDDGVQPEDVLGFRSVDISNLDTVHGWAESTRLEKGRIVVTLGTGLTFVLVDQDSTGLRAVMPEIGLEVDPAVEQIIAGVLQE